MKMSAVVQLTDIFPGFFDRTVRIQLRENDEVDLCTELLNADGTFHKWTKVPLSKDQEAAVRSHLDRLLDAKAAVAAGASVSLVEGVL